MSAFVLSETETAEVTGENETSNQEVPEESEESEENESSSEVDVFAFLSPQEMGRVAAGVLVSSGSEVLDVEFASEVVGWAESVRLDETLLALVLTGDLFVAKDERGLVFKAAMPAEKEEFARLISLTEAAITATWETEEE